MNTLTILFILSGVCDGTDIPAECWGIWNTTAPISKEQPANVNKPTQVIYCDYWHGCFTNKDGRT